MQKELRGGDFKNRNTRKKYTESLFNCEQKGIQKIDSQNKNDAYLFQRKERSLYKPRRGGTNHIFRRTNKKCQSILGNK